MDSRAVHKNLPAWLLALWCLAAAGGLALAAPAEGAMRKAPYIVYEGLNTEMRILWQLTASETCTLEWGPDPTCSARSVQTAEYGLDHQHTYAIPNLTPGAICHYRVTESTGSHTGSFRAAPPDEALTARFIAYGDTRSYPAVHDSVASRILARCAADPGLQTFILSVGDLVYNGDLEADWDSQFFSPLYPDLGALLGSFPYQAAIGNHERTGAGFVKYFPYPFVGGRYWSFDYGPAHFAIVDQYVSYAPGSNQLLWLESDLAATTKPWKFICLHEPGWSAGGGHENSTSVQTYIQPLCETYGVAAVFAGHNHYYARAAVNGVEHVTSGGGGAPLHTPNLLYPNVVTGTRAYGHCEIEINVDQLVLRAVTAADSLMDSLTMDLPECGAGASRRAGLRDPLLGPVAPNPFRETAMFSLWLPEAAQVDVAVFDVAGRRVRSLLEGQLRPGSNEVVWDGRDEGGRRVSPGIYLIGIGRGTGSAVKVVALD